MLVLAAAIGVPAFAAPADWSMSGADNSESAELAVAPETMPFEQPGMSFPGSAFYYLEDVPEASLALPALDPTDAPDDTSRLGKRIDAGPSALPFAIAGSGLDKARALRCLTQAIYYEAASESDAGQRAVAQVVLNRVAHPTWPSSVCGVVFEGSQRSTGCQFTFTCDGSMRRQPARKAWDRAQRAAARALGGRRVRANRSRDTLSHQLGQSLLGQDARPCRHNRGASLLSLERRGGGVRTHSLSAMRAAK